MNNNSHWVASCLGGAVAWFGVHYLIGRHFAYMREDTSNHSDCGETKNGKSMSNRINKLQKRVRALQISVLDLEERNDKLRKANRLLTKLANRSANIGFYDTQKLYKKLDRSPNSREEGEMIFIDYPSYEFSVVRPSSNEV